MYYEDLRKRNCSDLNLLLWGVDRGTNSESVVATLPFENGLSLSRCSANLISLLRDEKI